METTIANARPTAEAVDVWVTTYWHGTSGCAQPPVKA